MAQTLFGIRVDGTRRAAGAQGTWSPTGYENAVGFWLARIFATDTGRALRRALEPAHRLLIEPDQGEPGSPGTGPTTSTRAAWRDGTRRGAPARNGIGGLIGGVGTGAGTPVSIEFTPADFIGSDPEELPDMVLTHEIAHATRWLDGVASNAPMLPFGFLTREEVHTVLITNIYRSEQRLDRFRLSHRPSRYGTLAAAQRTFANGGDLIRLLASRQQVLYSDLADIQTRFNPIPAALAGSL